MVRFLLLGCLLFSSSVFAKQNILNIYGWYNEIPKSVIRDFEKQTGITVRLATYNDNEVLYAKLKATPKSGFDIVMPSNYFVQRMVRANMLDKLDKTKLPNYKNIGPNFQNPEYDAYNTYSLPHLWGSTGIFVNKRYIDPATVQNWSDLMDKKYRNQLMFLNDPMEVFGIAYLSMGLTVSSNDKSEISQAYEYLKRLMPNVRLFNSDSIPSIFIDEDVNIGMAWSGDVYRGSQVNKDLVFIYPKDGFVIWVDCLAIPRFAPHKENAYRFLNFLFTAKNSAAIIQKYGYATAIPSAKQFLPEAMQTSPMIFPNREIMQRSHFQKGVTQEARELYAYYWDLLKINA